MMTKTIGAYASRSFWSDFNIGYLTGFAWTGWLHVDMWLYFAATYATIATIPAAVTAVFWACCVQDFILARPRPWS